MPPRLVSPLKSPYRYLSTPIQVAPMFICNIQTLRNRLRDSRLEDKARLGRAVEIVPPRGRPPAPSTLADEVTSLLSIGCCAIAQDPQLSRAFRGGIYDVDRSTTFK